MRQQCLLNVHSWSHSRDRQPSVLPLPIDWLASMDLGYERGGEGHQVASAGTMMVWALFGH